VEIAIQLIKQLPAGWPRILVLLGLGLLFFFPEMRRMLTQGHREKERFGHAKQLLELRKLELTVAENTSEAVLSDEIHRKSTVCYLPCLN
jgi:hypothetical protein